MLKIQALADVQYTTSEQHQQASGSRIVRDNEDDDKMYEFMKDRQPFPSTTVLRNIVTGVVSGDHVNVFDAKTIGDHILANMIGQNVLKFKFKRSLGAKTMNTVVLNKGTDKFVVDPSKMFYRILTGAMFNRDTVSLEETLKHELVPYAPTLFESEDQLLDVSKSVLAASIRKITGMEDDTDQQSENTSSSMQLQYIVDGGMMLHMIKWEKGSTYSHICSMYYTWLSRYPQVTVVFDGYESSTKDMCHRKRVKDSCSNIIPTLQAKLVVTKYKFLSNINNKQLFLNLLQDYLKNKGLTILCSTGDADVLMCREAAECCYSDNVSLLGEDTDLLVILLHITKHHGLKTNCI